jgi:hypothetical protein
MRSASLELIERTAHAPPTLIQNVGMNHRRAHVAMPKEFLDRPDVIAGFEQAGRAMPAARAASLTARCRTDSCKWCRRRSPVAEST